MNKTLKCWHAITDEFFVGYIFAYSKGKAKTAAFHTFFFDYFRELKIKRCKGLDNKIDKFKLDKIKECFFLDVINDENEATLRELGYVITDYDKSCYYSERQNENRCFQ